MKSLVLVAILLSGCIKCQTGILGPVKTLPNIGDIIFDDFNGTSLSSNWTFNNQTGITYTVSGGKLNISKAGTEVTADTKHFFKYTGYTKSTLRNYKLEMQFTLNSVNDNSFGAVIAAYSERNPGQNMTSGGYYNLTNTGFPYYQYINIFGADGKDSINVVENALKKPITVTVGNVYKYTFQINEGQALFTAQNITTNETVSVSYAYNYADYTTNHVIPNIVSYGFGLTGNSSISIDYFRVSTTESPNPYIVFVGDSFTDGLYGGDPQNAFFKLLQSHTAGIVQEMAGGWDRSSDVIDNIAEIKMVNPKYVFLMIGINDLGNGVALSTLESNVTNIVNQLTAAGITVIPEMIKTGGDPTAAGTYNRWLKDTYPSTVDTYTGLYGAGYVDGSGHPNAAGEQQIADRIKTLRPDLFPN